MGGPSHLLNPLATLKLVCTSMIRGEDQYYRMASAKTTHISIKLSEHLVVQCDGKEYFDRIILSALDYDYEGVLRFVSELRNDYMMRLNTHVIVTAAIHHPKRVEFNKTHPNVMKQVIRDACLIPTDWATQGTLLLESKKCVPTIWKKTIAEELEKMSNYHAAKYLHGNKKSTPKKSKKSNSPEEPELSDLSDDDDQPPVPYVAQEEVAAAPPQKKKSKELNLIDLVHLTHPKKTDTIEELMRTGNVTIAETEATWERLRSSGKTWKEITSQIRVPHMALLRNLRNIVEEVEKDATVDEAYLDGILAQLVRGVKNGKQFPFRYYSAYKIMENQKTETEHRRRRHSAEETSNDPPHKSIPEVRRRVMESLNQCVMESLDTMPKLNGYVHCLSDNSGSARSTMVSEYGTTGIYEIANLSSLISAYMSTEGGSVWVFGDSLKEYKVSKEIPLLAQLSEINALGDTVGSSTETGIWLFWERAIQERIPLDTVFVYSDMQAGYGKLFATPEHRKNIQALNGIYQDIETMGNNESIYVDLLSLVKHYREHVKDDVNLFTIQVAGYDNSILPDILYRGAILSGWTGKESKLAEAMIRLW